MAWLTFLDGLCTGCGQPRDEAWGKDNQHVWRGQIRVCHACRQGEFAHRAHMNSAKKVETAGLHVTLHRNDD